MLGATEQGLGGCMISSIKREELQDELRIPDKYDILMILALGKPIEKVIVDEVSNGDVKYWRDEEKNHHVPKRNLNDLIIRI
jgi:nitroreductase